MITRRGSYPMYSRQQVYLRISKLASLTTCVTLWRLWRYFSIYYIAVNLHVFQAFSGRSKTEPCCPVACTVETRIAHISRMMRAPYLNMSILLLWGNCSLYQRSINLKKPIYCALMIHLFLSPLLFPDVSFYILTNYLYWDHRRTDFSFPIARYTNMRTLYWSNFLLSLAHLR